MRWLAPEAVAGDSLSDDEVRVFENYVRRRLDREPTQLIVGKWAFHDVEVNVRSPVLVPRPETEELVDLVLDWWGPRPARVVDVGCGTGCIGLAILEALPPGSSCLALDVDDAALDLARENGRGRRGYETKRRAAAHPKPDDDPVVDFIVSNPPYIPTADYLRLEPEVIDYEARLALDGGNDGLDVVRDLVLAAPTYLDPASSRTLWLELDVAHPPLLADPRARAALLPPTTATTIADVQAISDSSGRPRFAKVVFRPPPA
mmetsp:Transcript_18/g.59  ORF Transcript_18/g.59 Transcript_18/m.59 type:complete len:261 (+) Transcript_18:315-1097(+)